MNDVESFMCSYLHDHDFPDSQMGFIVLTVCESVTNAITHGNHEDIEKFVDIRVDCFDNELSIEIEDEGTGFNVHIVPDPTENNNIKNERGRGIFIIKNLADQVEFQNNGSLVKIKFNLKREHQFLL